MSVGDMHDMHIDDALNECLEHIDWGGTVEECLERYPSLADELAPLLRLAMSTRGAADALVPSPEAQRAGLGRITDAWAAREAQRRRGAWGVLRRSWVLAAVAALALVFGGWTTAAAAQDSIPGDTLYPVKQTQERVLLVVVFTQSGKADLHARLAEARTMEVAKLAAMGDDPVVIDETTQRMREHMNECVSLLGGQLSADPATSSGGLRLEVRRSRGAQLSNDSVVSGTLSIENGRGRMDRDSQFVQPWRGHGSERRAAMQARFYQQFQQYQEMRQVIRDDFRAFHRAQMEAAIARSETLLLEAVMLMQALEDAHHPPE